MERPLPAMRGKLPPRQNNQRFLLFFHRRRAVTFAPMVGFCPSAHISSAQIKIVIVGGNVNRLRSAPWAFVHDVKTSKSKAISWILRSVSKSNTTWFRRKYCVPL